MIDPKTLKVGDVVVFGGSVEYPVTEQCLDYGYLAFSDVDRLGVDKATIVDYHSLLWKIAELKKVKLPILSSISLWLRVDHYVNENGAKYSPSEALRILRSYVKLLEEAGVE